MGIGSEEREAERKRWWKARGREGGREGREKGRMREYYRWEG